MHKVPVFVCDAVTLALSHKYTDSLSLYVSMRA